jgi:hypothetical protein
MANAIESPDVGEQSTFLDRYSILIDIVQLQPAAATRSPYVSHLFFSTVAVALTGGVIALVAAGFFVHEVRSDGAASTLQALEYGNILVATMPHFKRFFFR